jgi:hypothetical protein
VLPSITDRFDFIHCPYGFMGLGTGGKYYAVCLYDGCFAKRRFDVLESWSRLNAVPAEARMAQRSELVKLAYGVMRMQPRLQVNVTGRPPRLILRARYLREPLPENVEDLKSMARSFGLQWTVDEAAGRAELRSAPPLGVKDSRFPA